MDSTKRILIINGPDAQPEDAELMTGFLHSAMRGVTDVHAVACRINQVAYTITNEHFNIIDQVRDTDLADYDLVWFRGKIASYISEVATIANYLHAKGIETLNSFYSKRRGVGKVNQMYLLATSGLAIPDTVSAASEVLPIYVERFLEYPVVVKDTHGSHGQQNYLVADRQALEAVLHDNPTVRFMAQRYIKAVGDYRLLFAGSECLIIHRVGGEHTHLNNTSQGAQARLVPPAQFSPQIIAEARRFADICDYEIAGVDVIIDSQSGRHYFLEINSQPQLATGVFLAEKQRLIGEYFGQLLQGSK